MLAQSGQLGLREETEEKIERLWRQMERIKKDDQLSPKGKELQVSLLRGTINDLERKQRETGGLVTQLKSGET